jgi:hypothetical protein
MKEICICAAVVTGDGILVRGHRHVDCLVAIRRMGKKEATSQGGRQQGFVTSINRYVTREEALEIQKEAGIVSADEIHGYTVNPKATGLFSEDLYIE